MADFQVFSNCTGYVKHLVLFHRLSFFLFLTFSSVKAIYDASEEEIFVATRRVQTAICAFGGWIPPAQQNHSNSIFRHRKSAAEEHYDLEFHRRYRVSGYSSISWEVEENPPVNIEQPGMNGTGLFARDRSPHRRSPQTVSPEGGSKMTKKSSHTDSNGSMIPSDSHQKMKYRYVPDALIQNCSSTLRFLLTRCYLKTTGVSYVGS